MMTEKKEEKEEQKEKENKRRCRKCGSFFGYIRFRDKTYVCRSCGFIDDEVII